MARALPALDHILVPMPPRTPDINTTLLDISERLAILETQTSTIMEEQNEAKVSRRLIHSKQDEITRRLDAAENLDKTLSEMKPLLQEHERIRQMFSGGIAVLAVIFSIVLVAAGFVLKEAWGWVAHHISLK